MCRSIYVMHCAYEWAQCVSDLTLILWLFLERMLVDNASNQSCGDADLCTQEKRYFSEVDRQSTYCYRHRYTCACYLSNCHSRMSLTLALTVSQQTLILGLTPWKWTTPNQHHQTLKGKWSVIFCVRVLRIVAFYDRICNAIIYDHFRL